MIQQEQDAPRADLARVDRWERQNASFAFFSYFRKMAAIAEIDARKIMRDPSDPLTRAVQPALWLLIFGNVFEHARMIPTGHTSYIAFMAPGILAQSVLFIGIFSGMAIIWERDVGTAGKLVVTPTPRTAIVLGKALAACIRTIPQAIIIYLLAILMHVQLRIDPVSVLGVMVAVLLGSTVFSTFSLLIACMAKSRERFMGIGQLLTMPLFFASNALYPISMMPEWLQWISKVNPLTYEVDALRSFMVGGASSHTALDLLILTAIAAVLVIACGRVYDNVVL